MYEDGNYEGWGGESWGHGCHEGHHGGFMILKVIKALQVDGSLTPKVFASLVVQWLPMITQRVTRKMDSINLAVKEHMSTTLTAFLVILEDHVSRFPGLEEFAAPIAAIAQGNGPDAPLLGDTLRSLLIVLQAQAFEVKVSFVEQLYEAVLPLLDDFTAESPCADHRPWWLPSPLVHHGVTCDHCQTAPIAGPRWKCTTCPNYDLCGNCFAQKTEIHASDHDFQCILDPHGWKAKGKGKGKEAKGKGKGKGKGCKGWGKSFGKGHIIPHIIPHMWRHMNHMNHAAAHAAQNMWQHMQQQKK